MFARLGQYSNHGRVRMPATRSHSMFEILAMSVDAEYPFTKAERAAVLSMKKLTVRPRRSQCLLRATSFLR